MKPEKEIEGAQHLVGLSAAWPSRVGTHDHYK